MGTIKKIAGLLLRVEESYHDYKKRSLLSLSGLIWRSVVVGLIYVVTSMIIASLGSSMGVASDTPTGVDPTIILLSMFVGGIMISLVMGPISTKLHAKNLPPLACHRRQTQMSTKRNVVLYVDAELVRKTRELGFDLSKTFENHLKMLITQFQNVYCQNNGGNCSFW